MTVKTAAPAAVSGLTGVQPHAAKASRAIAAQAGLTRVYGFRTVEQNNAAGGVSNSDHLIGLAVDFPCSTAQGNVMANYAVANAKALSVKYVIWNHRINLVDGKGWRDYTGRNPHTDHVHVSFTRTGAAGGLVDKLFDAASGLPLIGGVVDAGKNAAGAVTDAVDGVGDIAAALNPTTWANKAQQVGLKLAIVAAGLGLVMFGANRLVAGGLKQGLGEVMK